MGSVNSIINGFAYWGNTATTYVYTSAVSIAQTTLSLPFSVAKSFRNFAYSFVDPNWRSFVEDSRGHCCSSQDQKNIHLSIKQANSLFENFMSKEKDQTKEWCKVWSKQKETLLNEESLKKQMTGTCFGNCSVLTKEIIKKGKVLNISELQTIECESTFSTEAMTFQVINLVASKIGETVVKIFEKYKYEKGPEANLTEIQQKELGKRASKFPLQKDVDCLKTYPLTFEQIGQLEDEDFSILKSLAVNGVTWQKLQKSYKKVQDKGNFTDLVLLKGVIENIKKLPRIQRGFFMHHLSPSSADFVISQTLGSGTMLLQNNAEILVPKDSDVKVKKYFSTDENRLANDFKKNISELTSKTFSCVFMTAAMSTIESEGHEMVLEIDNDQKLYILYDNCRGFYQFKDLDSSLEGLAKCAAQYGSSMEVLPFVLSA